MPRLIRSVEKPCLRLYLDGTVPGERVRDAAMKVCEQYHALIKLDNTYIDQ